MVKSKKLLSFFLAVVMVLSVFTVMASAYTRFGAEGVADIDVKYTVTKVDAVPETAAGSAEWSADNIYAVTVWMKSAKPVDTFIVPFHYNKTLFAPITLSDGECTYPYGAGMDQDSYYSEMGEGAVYAYSLGDYMNNTGMYKANGTTATTKALAKCIGLGNSNSDGVSVTSELVSPDHPLYNKWGAGLPADTGVVYVNLDVAGATKTAYFNTLEGIATYTDWVNMYTLYFEALVDDVTGAEFGVYTDNCFTVDGNYDATGSSYFAGATSYQAAVPSMNVVSNAVVEEAKEPSPVFNKNSQIRFNAAPVGDAKADFDVRTRGYIAADALAALCGGSVTEDAITDIGFVFFAGEDMDLATAAEVAKNGSTGAYTRKQCSYVQATGSEYVWTCMVTDPAYDGTLQSVAYITVGGETYITDAAQETSFADLYDRNIDSYLGA